MNDIVAELQGVERALAAVACDAVAGDALRALRDDDLLRVMSAAGDVLRRAEAVLIASTAHTEERSEAGVEIKLTTRYGCRNTNELVQRATLVSAQRAAEVVRSAHAVQQHTIFSSGELAPAQFPHLREALSAGVIGLDGMSAIVSTLRGPAAVAGHEATLAADIELAAAARGDGDRPKQTAEELRIMAKVWSAFLDPDGVEPTETRALRRRGLRIGRLRDGLVPTDGNLLPEVAAQFLVILDSINNPRADVPGPRFSEPGSDEHAADVGDRRTAAQKRHDALATLLNKAAEFGGFPDVGGTPPTLVVSVREEDLVAGTGHAFVRIGDAEEPVPIGVARHYACIGNIQRTVFDGAGRIVGLSITGRIFNAVQRRAIIARDGTCIIPGCNVPACWAEIHHVVPAAEGGPTDTCNGVPICWWHHRHIDDGQWQIRMRDGVPEVRGPSWWDPHRLWRRASKSSLRLRDQVVMQQ
ncbi:HNH endonuclease signature motif containing protein [Microbacterium invictum]|uniref:HNH nuclease domain-containing protein n=1 Tax=Microbacterium invictum TaxID=515415 RepID=A0AA40SRY0_9MICO|nr:HNH endonuclease signature motif containing protein [Microbacterium invictum]MBB4141132.1 hypothetical protein [Microbacterium invictum]